MTAPPPGGHRASPPPPLWTVKDLARYLVLPLSTVYRLRHIGGGPPGHRLGKHVRYQEKDIVDWLETRRTIPWSTISAAPRPAADRRRTPLWTPAELTDHLTIPITTLYRWRTTGDDPPGFKIGKHLRFDRAEVADWFHALSDDPRSG